MIYCMIHGFESHPGQFFSLKKEKAVLGVHVQCIMYIHCIYYMFINTAMHIKYMYMYIHCRVGGIPPGKDMSLTLLHEKND